MILDKLRRTLCFHIDLQAFVPTHLFGLECQHFCSSGIIRGKSRLFRMHHADLVFGKTNSSNLSKHSKRKYFDQTDRKAIM